MGGSLFFRSLGRRNRTVYHIGPSTGGPLLVIRFAHIVMKGCVATATTRRGKVALACDHISSNRAGGPSGPSC